MKNKQSNAGNSHNKYFKKVYDKNPKRFCHRLKYERKDIKSNGLINLHKFYDAFQDIILIQFYALRFTIKE